MRIGRIIIGIVLALLAVSVTDARAQATLTVCASGCDYTNSAAQLQAALDAAAPGDTVLLQASYSYVGAFKLKEKATCVAADDTCYISVRTGVTAAGALSDTSGYPAAGVRVTPAHAATMAKLVVSTNNVGAIETSTSAGAVKYWRLQWLEFVANVYGGDTIIRIGSDSNTLQPTIASSPDRIIMDRIYVRGLPDSGQFRGISIHARNYSLINSHVSDIKSLGEGQGVWINSAAGPGLVENNYLSGGTETFLTGGAGGSGRPDVTVQASPAPTTTGARLSVVTELAVGQGVTFTVAGVEQYTEIATISGLDVTFAPALSAAPDVPGDVDWGVEVRNLTVRKNYMTRPITHRLPFVGTPTNVTAVAEGAGTLAAGTWYYKVVARHPAAAGATARSTASAEVSATTGTNGAVTISWDTVPYATSYYVYGRVSGGQTMRWSVTAPTTTLTDTGAAGTTENVPTTIGSTWQVKNTFELKNCSVCTVQGNIFENSWRDGQDGYVTLLTGTTQNSGNDSAHVRDVLFEHNIIRGGAGGMQITGRDANSNPSGRNGALTIRHNLWYDLNTGYGATSRWIIITAGGAASQSPKSPYDITIQHNTVDQTSGNAVLYLDLYRSSSYHTIENFIVRDNIFRKLNYGIMSVAGEGQIAPFQGTGSVYSHIVMSGASCSSYPAGTSCPTHTDVQTLTYTDYAALNYRVLATSPYYLTGSDSTSYGADIDAIEALTDIAESGNNSGGAPPPDPVSISSTTLTDATLNVAYSEALAATAGTTPYTWTLIAGALPTGLTLNTNGTISGTPIVVGPFDFTVQVDDAGSGTDTQAFTLTVLTPGGGGLVVEGGIEVDASRVYLGSAPCVLRAGSGGPEGVVVGSPCHTYWQTDDGRIWRKASGTGTTGWLEVGIPLGSALSVFGVAGSAPALNASIVSESDHQVLRRSGLSVGFGAVNLSEPAATEGNLLWARMPSGAGVWDASPEITGQIDIGAHIIPTVNWTSDLGSQTRKIRQAHIAELNVDTLVAQDVISTIGGEILTIPTTSLSEAIDATTTTITVEHNEAAVGDQLWLEGRGQFEMMAVTAGPSGGGGSIPQVEGAGTNSSGGAASLTWSHTVTGSNRLLMVSVSTASVTTSTATFCGESLSQLGFSTLGSDTSARRVEVWYLVAPPVATCDIVVTLASSAAVRAGSVSYTGVHQGTPFGTPVTASGYTNTVSVTVASATNDLVYDAISVRTALTTMSAGAGQTAHYNGYSGTSLPVGAASTAPGDTSVTMTWTVDDEEIKRWVSLGVAIKPLAASAGPYTYTVTRGFDGTAANSWIAGDAVANTGTTGDGYIHQYATGGRFGGTGPTMVGQVRTGTAYNAIGTRWAIGNLDGLYGYTAQTFGVGLGNASAVNVLIDDTNGLRIRHGTTNKISLTAAGNASFSGSVTASTGSIAGWSLQPNYLTSGSGGSFVALASDGTNALWAGSPDDTTAPFRLYANGSLVAANANITGTITATAGAIATWDISATDIISSSTGGRGVGLTAYTGSLTDRAFWVYDGSGYAFIVNHAGQLTATNAVITGAITATSGSFTGNGSGVTNINGGNITAATITTTQIGANSITTALLNAGAVTADKIAANTITASQIAAGTITATQIASGTITADRLNVSTLSAITADLGTVTTGTIDGPVATFGTVDLDSTGIAIPTGGKGSGGQIAFVGAVTSTISGIAFGGAIEVDGGLSVTAGITAGDTILANNIGADTGTTLVRNAGGFIKTDSSSERYKENIKPWVPVGGMDILKAQAIQFDYKGGTRGVVSFSAEQLYGIAPELVNLDADGSPDSIRTNAMLAFLVAALQSQQRRIEALESGR